MALRSRKCAVNWVAPQRPVQGGKPLCSAFTAPLLKSHFQISTAHKSSVSVASASASSSLTSSRWNHDRPEPLMKVELNGEADWNPNKIPRYLNETYWWAYIHPRAVQFFERQWLVDAILWGNYEKLRNDAFEECSKQRRRWEEECYSSSQMKKKKSGRNVLQMACVYGDFSHTLMRDHLGFMDTLHIVDVAPIQLYNTASKMVDLDDSLEHSIPSDKDGLRPKTMKRQVKLSQSDTSDMSMIFHNESMDCIYLFFLLHEQPRNVRMKSIYEALRVLKQGSESKLIIVDYHKPHSRMNPWMHLMRPILTYVEPFAIDLWNEPLEDLLYECMDELNAKKEATPLSSLLNSNNDDDYCMQAHQQCQQKCRLMIDKDDSYFGGLYQKLVISKVAYAL